MCRKANHLLHIFSCCDPSVKTHLFSSFCLSLNGAALWRVSCPQLRALEVSFNNVLRKIWSLPRHSHTGIVQSVAGLQSIYNTVLYRSRKLIASAKMFSDLRYFFQKVLLLHLRPLDIIFSVVINIANFIPTMTCFVPTLYEMHPAMNRHLNSDIYDISTL